MPQNSRRLVLILALAYFAGVFALAFVVGVGWTLWLAPRVGAVAAVLAELPLILTASWLWSRHLLRRHPLPSHSPALMMGALAFALLMAAELGLAQVLGRSAGAWLASLTTPAGLLGLAGQVGFGVMPGAVWQPSLRNRDR
jgi:hypothetical protein